MGSGIALKVRISLWRLCNNILLTCKKLSRRISSVQSYCPLCSDHVGDMAHIFFQCQLAERNMVKLPFSHLQDIFQGSASVLERMIEWPVFDSSHFAYILLCISNSINNTVFQHIYLVPSRIVLQVSGLVEEYLRLHYSLGGR